MPKTEIDQPASLQATTMPNKAETTPGTTKNTPKYDETDQAILNIVTSDPNITTNQIGHRLLTIGQCTSTDTVYKRLRRKDYLRREVEEIRQNHREQISRELMPLALKVTRKALKSKDMSEKDKHPYVQMVVKSDLGDQGADGKPATINIEHLERMQVLLK